MPSLGQVGIQQSSGAIPADNTAWASQPHIPLAVPQTPVQARGDMDGPSVHEAAAEGVSGSGSALPHAERIQAAFGPAHDISHVRAHVGGAAAVSSEAIGAQAYTTGHQIAFRDAPDVHTAAHEAAHVIQQQQGVQLSGDVGQAGDVYERHADAVADRVVAGESAAELLAAGPTGGGLSAGVSDPATKVAQPKQPHVQLQSESDEQESEKQQETLEERLNRITQTYRDMIADARGDGYNVAADNLQRFLDGTGGTKTESVAWLRSFGVVTSAEETNQGRFEDSLGDIAANMKDGETKSLNDYWDRLVEGSPFTELFYASGTSTLTSRGNFQLTRDDDIVTITGTVDHHWHDPYDWHAELSAFIPGHGTISDADALLLQQHRGAASFHMEAHWQQALSGTITVRDYWFDSNDLTWTGP